MGGKGELTTYGAKGSMIYSFKPLHFLFQIIITFLYFSELHFLFFQWLAVLHKLYDSFLSYFCLMPVLFTCLKVRSKYLSYPNRCKQIKEIEFRVQQDPKYHLKCHTFTGRLKSITNLIFWHLITFIFSSITLLFQKTAKQEGKRLRSEKVLFPKKNPHN